MVRRRSWTTRVLVMVSALALALGVAACGDDDDEAGSGTEGGGESVELTLAYVTTAQHPYGQAIDFFKQEVERASGGRITINTRPSYPQPEPQLLADVRGGSVDMATISTAIWDSAGINAFQALQAPLLVSNYQLESQILEGEIGQAMAESASETAGDVTVLTIHEGGLRKPVGAKNALDSVASFRGTKIRAPQSKVLAAGLQALGAEADPLPLPEVYQALKNGTVDGMEANLGLIATNKYYEVARFVTGNVNLWPFPTALVINNQVMERLSEEDQQILRDAAAKVPARSIEIVSTGSDLPQQLVNCGVQFVTATPAEVQGLQARAEQAYTSLSQDETTGRFLQQIQDLKEDAQAPAAPPPFPTSRTGSCELAG
ncbi:MAG TPA: TRAP transporter substrate-binding protein [Miltoncostaeaceae bacterium]|nr:TRAP transporter substrate-binding protein [Miltoncostaeaceae bacterium]